jgi:hypothetical protein
LSDCIIFAGPKNRQGYGRVYIRGKGSQKKFSAHRIAYADAHDLDVEAMGGVVLHSCDNPSCINPDHLTLGTDQDNMADMVRKGRSLKGERSPQAKLNREMIEEICKRYKKGCRISGAPALAKEFGITLSTGFKGSIRVCPNVRASIEPYH